MRVPQISTALPEEDPLDYMQYWRWTASLQEGTKGYQFHTACPDHLAHIMNVSWTEWGLGEVDRD